MKSNILSKYRSQITVVDGIKFHSKTEARVWCALKLRERAGEITDLKRQVKFELNEGGTFSYKYIADYTFFENGEYVVADAKGYVTAEFKKKCKLMKSVKGIEIRIIKK